MCVQSCACALEVLVDQSVGDWIGLGETGKWAISRRGTRTVSEPPNHSEHLLKTTRSL